MSDKGATTTSAPVPAAGAVSSQPAAAFARGRGIAMLAVACVAAGLIGSALRTPSQEAAQAFTASVDAPPTHILGAPAADAVRSLTPPKRQFPVLGKDPRATRLYYAQLREQLRWVPAKVGGRKLATPDARSRLLLAKSAAAQAQLHEVGLDWRDVYGVINAETTWIPRTGMGKNGVPSLGLAQFEPATAKAVGLKNPNDPVEAVHASAVLLKEAARWSARRIEPLDLDPRLHAAKLREGVSVYYNLSTKARKKWTGLNTARLPVETRRHIANVRKGARQAEQLYARVGREVASNS